MQLKEGELNEDQRINRCFIENRISLKIDASFSQSELQLCALLRMNLPSKEIAGLLNLSLSTIDQRRHQIRKKLKLESNQNLISYLISL